MSRIEVTEKILTAKITKGLKWADVAAKVEADPKGGRVRIVMSGKFLPYKMY